MDIFNILTDIFRTVFDDEEIQINRNTTANEIDGWDSLSDVNLIVAVERIFKIRFTPKVLLTLRNVGDLHDAIANDLAKDVDRV